MGDSVLNRVCHSNKTVIKNNNHYKNKSLEKYNWIPGNGDTFLFVLCSNLGLH